MNCYKCKTPNPDNWFYCRECGGKASQPAFTTNLYMGTEAGKRTDVEFSSTTIEEHTKQIMSNKKDKSDKFWADKVKQAGVR